MGDHYLHHGLVALFLLAFTVLSLIGMVRLYRERRYFGVALLLLATVIFGYSTWIAATL
ncbi:hypothetical protein GCM10010885_17590 [Alicyclobacillus cellulosilyticus]|uniref:Uncharacterized protein n=1 Tax=Alicyclobacillus cellulosilyticus TaxID=1003997 RepID=A0A917NKX5_9BACL|nr:DUF2759 family protein [Alicyclobacillus cellulosilyticus]GGJ08980.1 hypothetical protein GCM10010885_17590 [Alicyclobacillus cellulosilyticus]